MKKIVLILACWAFSLAVIAQDTQPAKTSTNADEIKTIFGNKTGKCNIPLGYFMELSGGYTRIGDQNVFLPGMSMGLILNHHWTIGASGNFVGISQELHYHDIYYDSVSGSMHGADLKGGYGGLLLEYTLLPKSRVHIAFPLMIGAGYLYYPKEEHHGDDSHSFHSPHQSNISSDHFFVVEPGVRVEFNMVKKLRIGLGISYRYTPDLKLQNTSPDLINQFNAKLSLRLGKF